jgi:sporulation protein YlmC with PRC-barrel domain
VHYYEQVDRREFSSQDYGIFLGYAVFPLSQDQCRVTVYMFIMCYSWFYVDGTVMTSYQVSASIGGTIKSGSGSVSDHASETEDGIIHRFNLGAYIFPNSEFPATISVNVTYSMSGISGFSSGTTVTTSVGAFSPELSMETLNGIILAVVIVAAVIVVIVLLVVRHKRKVAAERQSLHIRMESGENVVQDELDAIQAYIKKNRGEPTIAVPVGTSSTLEGIPPGHEILYSSLCQYKDESTSGSGLIGSIAAIAINESSKYWSHELLTEHGAAFSSKEGKPIYIPWEAVIAVNNDRIFVGVARSFRLKRDEATETPEAFKRRSMEFPVHICPYIIYNKKAFLASPEGDALKGYDRRVIVNNLNQMVKHVRKRAEQLGLPVPPVEKYVQP